MKKFFLLWAAILCLATVGLAQTRTFVASTIVAQLPSASLAGSGTLFFVTDGAAAPDCTIGSGTFTVLCRSNGTTWVAVPNSSLVPGTVAGPDYLPTSTATNVVTWEQIASGLSCGDSSHALNYSTSTHQFGCQTITTGGSPGGANTQVQFNNSGAFGGSANLTWNGTNLLVGGNTLCPEGTSTTQVLFNSSNACGGSANLTWNGTNLLVGGNTLCPESTSTTQVLFNNASACGGSANLTWKNSSSIFNIGQISTVPAGFISYYGTVPIDQVASFYTQPNSTPYGAPIGAYGFNMAHFIGAIHGWSWSDNTVGWGNPPLGIGADSDISGVVSSSPGNSRAVGMASFVSNLNGSNLTSGDSGYESGALTGFRTEGGVQDTSHVDYLEGFIGHVGESGANCSGCSVGNVIQFYSLPAEIGPGAFTNNYGFYASTPALNGVATLTNNYGLYIANQAGVASTLNYAIYSAGGQSYHAGNFSFGADVLPAVTNTSNLGNSSLVYKNLFTNILSLPEVTAPSGASSTDVVWGDSSAHELKVKLNNGSALFIPNTDGSGVSGHCAAFTSAYEIIDNGGACGSGGTGTVTNFSSGNLSPLFTTSVANAGTTPALSFTLSTATAHTMFGNHTGSTASPTFANLNTNDWSPFAYAADSGAVNAAVVTLAPAATALVAGLEVKFLPTANNTSSTPTVNVNGLGAKTITKNGAAALANGDLTTTAIAILVYDGTEFQLINPQTVSGSAVTIQTNSSNNTSQTTLNFTNTAGASGINFTNPSGGVESASLASAAGGGNAVLQGTLTGPTAGDFICENGSTVLVNCTPGIAPNVQSGTTYTVLQSDRGIPIFFSNGSSIAVTLNGPGSYTSHFYFCAMSLHGAGTVTITASSGTIFSSAASGSSLALTAGQHACLYTDGTNFYTLGP